MKKANDLLNEMENKLKEKMSKGELDLRELDDITFNCVEEFKKMVLEYAGDLIQCEEGKYKKMSRVPKGKQPQKI